MNWYEQLYIGERVLPYAKKIRKRLDAGQTDLGHYVITLASNPADLLDMMSTSFLTQESLRSRLPMIVGIAADRAEAEELVMNIVNDCVRETGGTDIRKYLQKS